ncbi:hypothetical protein GCK32_006479 [Trichostrongylus colubriformis]|uniref:Uncharacterized protein n=1 Tax=Trichostrongylus colubriformis TaxID=6319 RepID=A0AAN8IPK8_TRICO
MKSSSRRHELLCIGLLGIGYYGQAVHQSVFGLSCLAAPTIQRYMASKWALVTCAVLFCAFYLGFFHVNRYFFYFTQILMGCAYSLYNNGEGAYIAEHSSRQTVESNTAIETAVGHSSMLFGGLVLFYVFYTIPEKHLGIVKFRDFSDSQIQAINGMFFVLALVHAASIATAVILFWLSTPSRSTINPNDGASLLIHPSPKLVVVIAFLIGIGDFAITTARVTMCQLAKPENRNEVFSLTRISMCLSSCIVLFLSSRMTVEYWSIVLLSTMLIGTVTLLIVANRATRVGTPQVVKYA